MGIKAQDRTEKEKGEGEKGETENASDRERQKERHTQDLGRRENKDRVRHKLLEGRILKTQPHDALLSVFGDEGTRRTEWLNWTLLYTVALF